MSDTDSFIREVNEEIERDRMNRMLKKWGPYIAVLIILIVGAAAAWNWKQEQDRQAREEIGRVLLSADPLVIEDNQDALTGGAAILGHLRLAEIEVAAGNVEAALRHYNAVAENPEASLAFADLAALRILRLRAVQEPPKDLLALIDPLTGPERPYRLLALELRAVLLLNDDQVNDAHADLRAIMADPERTGNLQARAEQLLRASGGAVTE
ncbi:MAG: tetratricopeptide repeat protein [Pseudomonadota bacterium]